MNAAPLNNFSKRRPAPLSAPGHSHLLVPGILAQGRLVHARTAQGFSSGPRNLCFGESHTPHFEPVASGESPLAQPCWGEGTLSLKTFDWKEGDTEVCLPVPLRSELISWTRTRAGRPRAGLWGHRHE